MNSPIHSPVISVIVAIYNGHATLQQCLDSVSTQTYPNIELIVIDGGSTDGTTDLIQRNAQHIAYWVSEPDRGIYNAWNKGLAKATGEWICFLGADDFLWDAQVFARMAAQLVLLAADVRLAYGQIMLLDHDDQALFPLGQAWNTLRERFRQEMCIPHPAVMHRRSLFEKHGLFDESFRIAGDYEMLLRELKDGTAVFFPEIVVAAMRQGGISSHPKNTLLTLREARRAQRSAGLFWPSRVWFMAVARVYIRMFLWHLLGENRTRGLLDLGRRIMGQPAYWTKT